MEGVVGKGKLKCCQGVGGMGGVLLRVWARAVTEDGDCDAAGGEGHKLERARCFGGAGKGAWILGRGSLAESLSRPLDAGFAKGLSHLLHFEGLGQNRDLEVRARVVGLEACVGL